MEAVCTSSHKGPTEEQSKVFLNQILSTRDTILQAYRTDIDPLMHVVKTIPNGQFNKIADVGCGTGNFLWHVVSLYPEAEAIGYNLYDCQARLGRSMGLDIRTLDFLNEDVHEKEFDLVICNYTLGYFNKEERDRVMRKLEGMLCHGGRLSIYDIAPRTMLDTDILDYYLVTPREMYRSIRRAFGTKASIRHIQFTDQQVVFADNIRQVGSQQQLDLFRHCARPVHYIVSKPTEKEIYGYG